MSFIVKIITEDHTHDQYILKPLVERMMRELGKPKAVVDLVTDPKLDGYEHAKSQIDTICLKYSFANLILFIPDKDCNQHRPQRLKDIEREKQEQGFNFFSEPAVEEVETWLLAGYANSLNANFRNVIRPDCSVKENWFEPFLASNGNNNPGGGRLELMKGALSNFQAIKQRCPEIADLMKRIEKRMN